MANYALLDSYGWEETAQPARFEHLHFRGEFIVAREDGRGWYHANADGKILAHSRYDLELSEHLKRIQPGIMD